MCTDLRLVRLGEQHVSGRTLDFATELESRLQVVPPGQRWSAAQTGTAAGTARWTNAHGYVAIDALGFDWVACDGLNDAGLSIGTLWLPETDLPQDRGLRCSPRDRPAPFRFLDPGHLRECSGRPPGFRGGAAVEHPDRADLAR